MSSPCKYTIISSETVDIHFYVAFCGLCREHLISKKHVLKAWWLKSGKVCNTGVRHTKRLENCMLNLEFRTSLWRDVIFYALWCRHSTFEKICIIQEHCCISLVNTSKFPHYDHATGGRFLAVGSKNKKIMKCGISLSWNNRLEHFLSVFFFVFIQPQNSRIVFYGLQ